MSAVHAWCGLCGRKTSVDWAMVTDPAMPFCGKQRRMCADCKNKQPPAKPKGEVRK